MAYLGNSLKAVVWVVVLAVISASPAEARHRDTNPKDKAAEFLLYFGMAGCVVGANVPLPQARAIVIGGACLAPLGIAGSLKGFDAIQSAFGAGENEFLEYYQRHPEALSHLAQGSDRQIKGFVDANPGLRALVDQERARSVTGSAN